MRIARVIGKVTLNRKMAEVLPGSYLIVRPFDRGTLCGSNEGSNEESPVLYDPLSAREGDRVGLVEGREASVPFHPDKVPYDAYNACILDTIDFDAVLDVTGKDEPVRRNRGGK
jgi:ethanolamine utilization protein EutN